MDDTIKTIAGVGIFLGIVAIVALLVSKNAQTPAVVQAFGSAFGGALQAAVSPVTQSGGSNSFGGALG